MISPVLTTFAHELVEQTAEMHARVPGSKTPPRAYHPGRRFPAHVYQRVGLLELILEAIAAHGVPTGDSAEGA